MSRNALILNYLANSRGKRGLGAPTLGLYNHWHSIAETVITKSSAVESDLHSKPQAKARNREAEQLPEDMTVWLPA